MFGLTLFCLYLALLTSTHVSMVPTCIPQDLIVENRGGQGSG